MTQSSGRNRFLSGRQRSLLRELVSVVARPDILSFAGGLPATELLPTEDFSRALQHVLVQQADALQYRPPYQPLVQHIVRLMNRRGVSCDEEQILITSGAQQGIQILAQLLLRDSSSVVLEEATYSGVECAIAPHAPLVRTVATSLDVGLDPEELRSCLDSGPKPAFLYTIPDSHNPRGCSMPESNRRALARIAREYELPVIEDDPYGFLAFDGQLWSPIRSHDSDWIFYLGTFSKIIAPALRLGWMVLPSDAVGEAEIIKDALDLESPALIQRAVSRYLDECDLFTRIDELRTSYQSRCKAMLQALERHFPDDTQWSTPRGGFFVWVELAGGVDTRQLLDRSIASERIAFVPGAAFTVGEAEAPYGLRLSFSMTTPAQIEDGLERLAGLL